MGDESNSEADPSFSRRDFADLIDTNKDAIADNLERYQAVAKRLNIPVRGVEYDPVPRTVLPAGVVIDLATGRYKN